MSGVQVPSLRPETAVTIYLMAVFINMIPIILFFLVTSTLTFSFSRKFKNGNGVSLSLKNDLITCLLAFGAIGVLGGPSTGISGCRRKAYLNEVTRRFECKRNRKAVRFDSSDTHQTL